MSVLLMPSWGTRSPYPRREGIPYACSSCGEGAPPGQSGSKRRRLRTEIWGRLWLKQQRANVLLLSRWFALTIRCASVRIPVTTRQPPVDRTFCIRDGQSQALFAAFAWIGVVIFGIAMVIFFKDTFRMMIISCFQTRLVDRERRKLGKQRSKEKFQARIDTTKVVPISHANGENKRENPKRQFSRSRERGLTSQLFDANLEATTTTKLIMRDEKRKGIKEARAKKNAAVMGEMMGMAQIRKKQQPNEEDA